MTRYNRENTPNHEERFPFEATFDIRYQTQASILTMNKIIVWVIDAYEEKYGKGTNFDSVIDCTSRHNGPDDETMFLWCTDQEILVQAKLIFG